MTAPASVDDYLRSLPAGPREALETIRETIKAAAPEATETIGWQMPGFKDHGRWLVTYAAFKDHCSLFPMSTKVIEDYREELAPYFTGKGTIRFGIGEPLPVALVKKLVAARLEENAALSGR